MRSNRLHSRADENEPPPFLIVRTSRGKVPYQRYEVDAGTDPAADRRETVPLRASSTRLWAMIQQGFPARILREIQRTTFLGPSDIDAYLIDRRTAGRREKAGRLSAEESERVARLLRILELAEETFGEGAAVEQWLRTPKPFLAGASPLQAIRTETGGRILEEELIALQHGFAA